VQGLQRQPPDLQAQAGLALSVLVIVFLLCFAIWRISSSLRTVVRSQALNRRSDIRRLPSLRARPWRARPSLWRVGRHFCEAGAVVYRDPAILVYRLLSLLLGLLLPVGMLVARACGGGEGNFDGDPEDGTHPRGGRGLRGIARRLRRRCVGAAFLPRLDREPRRAGPGSALHLGVPGHAPALQRAQSLRLDPRGDRAELRHDPFEAAARLPRLSGMTTRIRLVAAHRGSPA
jgi:hypothetical protein